MQIHSLISATPFAAYACAVTVSTLAVGQIYRWTWIRSRSDSVTPTGFGAFLAPVVLGAVLVSQASTALVNSLAVVTLVTAIYWFDDIAHLSARTRIFLSFMSGIGIGLAYLDNGAAVYPLLIAEVLAAGLMCIVLTNMVNFCDGADLNLASYIALTYATILWFGPSNGDWPTVAVTALSFILPFALMNFRPRTIYLGDSGSFAFAGMLTAMAVSFVQNLSNIAPEAAIPTALPTLDVAYVLTVRIIAGHDMLTRNYLHLYQRLNGRYSGFGYLLPQFANLALCLSAAHMLHAWGVGRILSVALAMIFATPIFYYLCRKIWLAGPPEGALFETSR